MSRRRKREYDADQAVADFHDFLLGLPAWVGPVLAGVAFLVLRFVVPAVWPSGNEAGRVLFIPLSRMLAPWVAVIMLGTWVVAEVSKLRRRRLLDGQSGVASLRSISWQEFERLLAEAYRRQGYLVEERGGSGGDGGIDVLLRKGSERVIVQCKQWKAWSVGVKPVRELYGAMVSEKADRAVLATTGRFTREAVRFAEGKPVELLGGDAVWNLVRSVQPTGDAPPTPSAAPACPNCGSPMVRRTARTGANAGQAFLGCSRFPECRGIRTEP